MNPKHELRLNRCESACSAHTLQLCTLVRATIVFQQLFNKKTTVARTRVQSIALFEHNFDFRWGFAIFVEALLNRSESAKNTFSIVKKNELEEYMPFLLLGWSLLIIYYNKYNWLWGCTS